MTSNTYINTYAYIYIYIYTNKASTIVAGKDRICHFWPGFQKIFLYTKIFSLFSPFPTMKSDVVV
jgi:hypothetical protein